RVRHPARAGDAVLRLSPERSKGSFDRAGLTRPAGQRGVLSGGVSGRRTQSERGEEVAGGGLAAGLTKLSCSRAATAATARSAGTTAGRRLRARVRPVWPRAPAAAGASRPAALPARRTTPRRRR